LEICPGERKRDQQPCATGGVLRARADEYDEWWLRKGRYDRGPELNAQWFSDIGELDAALRKFEPRGKILELAGGTGIWTEKLLGYADRLTVVDASSEMLAINAKRVGSTRVRYLQADLFAWTPSEQFARLPDAEIHHVGSTAVRGSVTKGDLDVLVRVPQDAFQAAEDVLASIFERNTESTRSADFSAFLDKRTNPELGVQLVAVGGSADTFLAWRSMLETDPDLREKYNELKRAYEGRPMEEYREAKARFITKHLAGSSGRRCDR